MRALRLGISKQGTMSRDALFLVMLLPAANNRANGIATDSPATSSQNFPLEETPEPVYNIIRKFLFSYFIKGGYDYG